MMFIDMHICHVHTLTCMLLAHKSVVAHECSKAGSSGKGPRSRATGRRSLA